MNSPLKYLIKHIVFSVIYPGIIRKQKYGHIYVSNSEIAQKCHFRMEINTIFVIIIPYKKKRLTVKEDGARKGEYHFDC